MYFFVKYIDYETFKKAEETESARNSLDCNTKMEEHKELIVNPDCFIGIILDYIFKALGIEEDLRRYFDLWTERAKPTNVAVFEPTSSGINIFSERAVYYVVYKDPKEITSEVKPLLYKRSREYLDFFAYLRRRSSTNRRRGSLSKSTSKSSQGRGPATKSSKGSDAQSTSTKKTKSSKSLV